MKDMCLTVYALLKNKTQATYIDLFEKSFSLPNKIIRAGND